MIVLDTDVVSELMKRAPQSQVIDWLNSHAVDSIWTTAIAIFEIWFGIEMLERGPKRQVLKLAFERARETILEHRVLPFDEAAATQAATIGTNARRSGRTVEIRDLQIAAIASVRRATLATRNVRHFEHLGIRLVDPWSAP